MVYLVVELEGWQFSDDILVYFGTALRIQGRGRVAEFLEIGFPWKIRARGACSDALRCAEYRGGMRVCFVVCIS